MNKRVQKILLIFLCGYFLAPAANGKVWLLPDYQARQLYSHRVNKEDSSRPSDRPQGVNCHMYGFIPASEIGEGVSCSSQTRIMNVTCYGDCACLPTYNKTESSCRLEGKIPGGSVCMEEYYTECLCDTSLYPHTSSSCVYTLSGASCSDNNGKHYTECIDPCEGLVDNTTDLGCEKYYDECPSMCEVGKTCVPNDCSAYTLTSCPANASCETCTPGCGNDNTVYYRFQSCQTNYIDTNHWYEDVIRRFWIPNNS